MEKQLIDHLFRHHYGKMVAVLTRIFGLQHLETIEDAVQDTFLSASQKWKQTQPENPEAWLTTAAKNRVLDIFRKIKAEKTRNLKLNSGLQTIAIRELFLDEEIADSQLRMIFTACHPALDAKDRIAFALKTVSGFSTKEIAASLLIKEETIKKRLVRARKRISNKGLSFEIPQGQDLQPRLATVHEVLYLIFNEGFHSNHAEILIRKELCAEAMRLIKIILESPTTRSSVGYALFALMAFHAARIDSRQDKEGNIIDLKHQDRKSWHFPLVRLGNDLMEKAVETEVFTPYHYEAAIAAEHIKAVNFEKTDWNKILHWLNRLYDINPSSLTRLNIAVVKLQLGELEAAFQAVKDLSISSLEQRAYLYYAFLSEYYVQKGQMELAHQAIDTALLQVSNKIEKQYLQQKKRLIKPM